MAQQIRLFITQDTDTLIDTLYYEIWYRVLSNGGWKQGIFYSPLPTVTAALSPWTDVPAILLAPLNDATDYEYKIRRFDSNNQYGIWTVGTFTTGS
jgi:hypothetical protein